MEEKNLVTLPSKVADYLESMKKIGINLRGALNVVNSSDETKNSWETILPMVKTKKNFLLLG